MTEPLQTELLAKVSRTFALTMPQLPEPLVDWVGNAYLLCRIADTIEDEPSLPCDVKTRFIQLFLDVLCWPATPRSYFVTNWLRCFLMEHPRQNMS